MLTRGGWRAAAGFTLVELLVTLVLLGLVGATLLRVLVGQQRFYDGATRSLEVRDNVREVAGIVPADLRGIAAGDGDIYAMSDTALDFRLPIGGTVICSIDAARTSLQIPPLALASRAALTYWASTPLPGDSILVLDEAGTKALSDDVWRRYRIIAGPTSAQTCPQASGFTSSAAEAAAGFRVTIGAALPATIAAGAPVRFFRRAHYALYTETSGQAYLGYFDCAGGTCGTLSPVSGPFVPYAAGAAGGIGFTYFDSTGAATTVPANVARVRLSVRGRTKGGISRAGEARGADTGDSLTIGIALRNRP